MKPNKPQLYATIGIIIGLLIISITIPINKNIDISTTISISYPLIWSDPHITDVTTSVTSHTLFHLPDISTADIISKSNVKLKVIGNGQSVTKSIGTIYRTQDYTYTVILPNVHPSTNTITVELYSGSTLLDSKEVTLT